MSSEDPLDIHGVKKLYMSATRSDAPAPFIMGTANWKDRTDQWVGEGTFQNDGTLNVIYTSTATDKQRMNVYADPSKPAVPSDADQLDRDVLRERSDSDGVIRGGWMANSHDWRDYEITAIEFIPKNPQGSSADPDETSAWYGRGAKHTGTTIDAGSQGSAYKPDLWYKGSHKGWHVLKETLHYDGYTGGSENIREKDDGNENVQFNQNIGNIKNKWIGIKTVVFNWVNPIPYQGSRYWPVQIETWTCDCDTNGNPNNNWVRRFMCLDHPAAYGEWGSLPSGQPGRNSTMSWGGPIITCRTDRESGTGGGYPGMKFKKVSIREILPNQRL